MTRTEFLLARIAEDEAVARAVEPGQYTPHLVPEVERGRLWCEETDYGDVVASSPARVLAECEAKRAVVELWQALDALAREVWMTDPEEARSARDSRAGVHAALVALAAIYDQHLDFDPVWAV